MENLYGQKIVRSKPRIYKTILSKLKHLLVYVRAVVSRRGILIIIVDIIACFRIEILSQIFVLSLDSIIYDCDYNSLASIAKYPCLNHVHVLLLLNFRIQRPVLQQRYACSQFAGLSTTHSKLIVPSQLENVTTKLQQKQSSHQPSSIIKRRDFHAVSK